ncbi:hypothetical protein BDV18DRAFT_163145 [Aspergillus unguis]
MPTKHPRSPPPLEVLAPLIQSSLQKNFQHASASITQCPDLRLPPFGLAAPGLCRNPRIADIGGQDNLFPVPNRDARYDLLALAADMGMDPKQGMLIGAGAAPWFGIGHNAELAPNIAWRGKSGDSKFNERLEVENKTRVVEVCDDGNKICCRPSPSTNCALMANLFGSDGLPGPVIKITARNRTGPENFTNAIRKGLYQIYGDHPISLGGVFLLKKGKAKFHVMPDFQSSPFKNRQVLEKEWLKYQTCEAPVVCLTVFHTADPEGLGLRMEHTHCFDLEGNQKGGHYHYDEGEEVEYEAYLNVAEVLYRIDRPGIQKH